MESGRYSFTKRILIEGMAYPVNFIFHMLNGANGTEYKVRTSNPSGEFNMYITRANNVTIYKFEDPADVPEWLRGDKDAQHKLSDAILSVY